MCSTDVTPDVPYFPTSKGYQEGVLCSDNILRTCVNGAQVSSGLSAWTAHLLVLKLVLWLLGVPSAVPFLEALCYTGYPLVSVCINTVVVTLLGEPSPCPPCMSHTVIVSAGIIGDQAVMLAAS